MKADPEITEWGRIIQILKVEESTTAYFICRAIKDMPFYEVDRQICMMARCKAIKRVWIESQTLSEWIETFTL